MPWLKYGENNIYRDVTWTLISQTLLKPVRNFQNTKNFFLKKKKTFFFWKIKILSIFLKIGCEGVFLTY